MAKVKVDLAVAVVRAIRKAGRPNGLRIAEIVKTTRAKRASVSRVLLALRKTRTLKMTGRRRAARYTVVKS